MSQPQTQLVPEALQGINSKWANGVAPGYAPTKGSGLTLNIGAGTSFAGNVRHAYAAGTLAMTNTATNYVFLDTTASNAPAVNTTGYPTSGIPIATVVCAGGVITSIQDDRTWFATSTSVPNTGVYSTVGITIDGGGSVPATGSKGFIQIPYGATITGWSLAADQAGLAQITVKKCADGAFPTTASIVAAAQPKLTGPQQMNESTSVGTWTTAITALDWLEFNLDSVTTCTRLTLTLRLTRT